MRLRTCHHLLIYLATFLIKPEQARSGNSEKCLGTVTSPGGGIKQDRAGPWVCTWHPLQLGQCPPHGHTVPGAEPGLCERETGGSGCWLGHSILTADGILGTCSLMISDFYSLFFFLSYRTARKETSNLCKTEEKDKTNNFFHWSVTELTPMQPRTLKNSL